MVAWLCKSLQIDKPVHTAGKTQLACCPSPRYWTEPRQYLYKCSPAGEHRSMSAEIEAIFTHPSIYPLSSSYPELGCSG